MFQIYLIRPGATEFDVQGRIQGNLDVPLGEVAGWSSIACGPKRGGALVRERMPDGTKYEWTLESKGMSLAPEQASSTTPRGA